MIGRFFIMSHNVKKATLNDSTKDYERQEPPALRHDNDDYTDLLHDMDGRETEAVYAYSQNERPNM